MFDLRGENLDPEQDASSDLQLNQEELARNKSQACVVDDGFPQRILRVRCGSFQHQRRVIFERCVADPLQTITAILPGSNWTCLLLSYFASGRAGQSAQGVPTFEAEVFRR